MEIIKGQTAEIRCTVYSFWSGQPATSTLANLTGATINAYFKNRDGDADVDALFTIAGVNVDAANGLCKIVIPASSTNGLNNTKIVFEVVVKLSNGEYIRNGVQDLILQPNVGKTLF